MTEIWPCCCFSSIILRQMMKNRKKKSCENESNLFSSTFNHFPTFNPLSEPRVAPLKISANQIIYGLLFGVTPLYVTFSLCLSVPNIVSVPHSLISLFSKLV